MIINERSPIFIEETIFEEVLTYQSFTENGGLSFPFKLLPWDKIRIPTDRVEILDIRNADEKEKNVTASILVRVFRKREESAKEYLRRMDQITKRDEFKIEVESTTSYFKAYF